MNITIDLPDDLAARLAARPDASQFAATVLADALLAAEGDADLLTRINAAYVLPSEDASELEEQACLSRLRRHHHRSVVEREAW